jgi:hypothetical protein
MKENLDTIKKTGLYSKLQKSFYNLGFWLFQIPKDLRVLSVDFTKPWWVILNKQKAIFTIALVSEVLQAVYNTLLPIIFVRLIETQNYILLIYNLLAVLLIELINRVVMRYFSVMYNNISLSIKFQAYEYFLTVDPIFHTLKSSGTIISKIENTTNNIGDFLGRLVGGFVPIFAGFTTTVIALFTIDFRLGLVALIFYTIIVLSNAGMQFLSASSFTPEVIKQRDLTQALFTENILQNWYIRSTFSTNDQVAKSKKAILTSQAVFSTAWVTSGLIVTLTRYLYFTSLTIIAVIVINKIQTEELSLAFGLSVVLTYLGGSRDITVAGDIVQNMTENHTKLKDLYKFISSFGHQTYPVLDEDKELK